MDFLHPIRLIARRDTDVDTVLHSFFICHTAASHELIIDSRYPQNRSQLDAVEEGLRGLMAESVHESADGQQDVGHNFVMTNHEGRLFVVIRQIQSTIIAMVTKLPILSFCRAFLEQLDSEPAELILPMIAAICEIPIFPAPNMKYLFQFSNNHLDITFSSLEHANEMDIDLVLQFFLTPAMIVKAWEALITERRILVVARDESILLPCCEFFRRLVAPMPYSGTFIPNLPTSGFEAVQAPGTFIFGAQVDALREAEQDLSGLMVIDLDQQTVMNVSSAADDPSHHLLAPPFLLNRLTHHVSDILTSSAAIWCSRSHDAGHNPVAYEELSKRTMEITNLFMQTNLTMICAQFCSMAAFFRTSFHPTARVKSCFQGISVHRELVTRSPRVSYSEVHSVSVGFLQRWKDSNVDTAEAMHSTLPCWVEMDYHTMAVYDFADDLPVLSIPMDEIEAVMTSPFEPEGHVFDLLLHNQQCYRFTTGEKDSRRMWLTALEERLEKCRADSSPVAPTPGIVIVTAAPVNKLLNSSTVLAITSHPDLSDPNSLAKYLDFRRVVLRTQLVICLYEMMECDKFESLPQRREGLFPYMSEGHSYESNMSRHIAKLGRTSDIIAQMMREQSHQLEASEPHVQRPRLTIHEISELEKGTGSDATPLRRRGSKFLRLLFSSSSSSSLEGEASAGSSEEEKLRISDRETKKKYVHDVKDKMGMLRAIYERCAVDIKSSIGDDRNAAFGKYFQRESCEAERMVEYDMVSLAQTVLQRLDSSRERRNSSPVRPRNSTTVSSYSPTNSLKTNNEKLLCNKLLAATRVDLMKDSQLWSNCVTMDDSIPCGCNDELADDIPLEDGAQLKYGIELSVEFVCNQFSEAEIDLDRLETILKEELQAVLDLKSKSSAIHSGGQCLEPVLEVLLGYMLQTNGSHKKALEMYGHGNLVHQRRIGECLLQLFVDQRAVCQDRKERFSEVAFITAAHQINPTVGMHAYRLCLELVHTELRSYLGGSKAFFEKSLMLHARSSIRSERNANGRTNSMRNKTNGVQFTWAEAENKSDIINETYMCTNLETTIHPCDISADLLCRLQEVLKEYAQSSAGEGHCKKEKGKYRIKINPFMLKDIQHLSAFKKFEIECCQLQKLNIIGMNANERALFFTNIYNMLITHGIIRRGVGGAGVIDRHTSRRTTKYNIGGFIFSLIDIKYGILRATTTSIVVGPVSLDWNFADRDPRRQFSLTESSPNITLCLSQACVTSPPTSVFGNIQSVESDMLYHCRMFLLQNVVLDASSRTIMLPELFRLFWSDFGKSKQEVLNYVATVAGKQFAAKMRDFIAIVGKGKIKIDFIPIDWTPMFIVPDGSL